MTRYTYLTGSVYRVIRVCECAVLIHSSQAVKQALGAWVNEGLVAATAAAIEGDVWSQLPAILTSSGFTGGGVFVVLIVLFSRGLIWTKPQVDTALSAKDEVAEGIRREAVQMEKDRDFWRDTAGTERERGDGAIDKVVGEVVPLVKLTNAYLHNIDEAARSGGAGGHPDRTE